jgi:CDP-glucose 4,6-dehydratase
MLGEKLLHEHREFAQAWNFGPDIEGNRTVAEVLSQLGAHWRELRWHNTEQAQPHEAKLLYLDNAKARNQLGWTPVWNIENALAATVDWYSAWLRDNRVISKNQISTYITAAIQKNAAWTHC